MPLPARKPNRLKNYDYASPGAYFITICTKDKKCIFWQKVGETIRQPEDVQLSKLGKIVKMAIENIPKHYPSLSLENYVVMPNHVHLLLQISGQPMAAPTHASVGAATSRPRAPRISQAVGQMKAAASRQAGFPLWQKLFHDHVVRNDKDYQRIWEYIQTNEMRWNDDCFYVEPPHP